MRKVAVHELIDDNKRLQQVVVVIEGKKVKDFYSFSEEQPMTEWWGGIIHLKHLPDSSVEAYCNGELVEEDSMKKG